MKLGIGLPNAVPGTTVERLTGWAKAAEDAGFSTLGTIDRVVYPNLEPMTALAAAAAVTDRIGLGTSVLLGPIRANPAIIAKQALSVDALAGGGRVMLGIAVGGREDDYEVSRLPMETRGAWLEDALAEVRAIFEGEGELRSKVGPRPQNGGPKLIVGGSVDAAFERAAKYGEGWIMGGGAPDQFAEGLEKLQAAWRQQGRDGKPEAKALAYFSLGDSAEKAAQSYLGDYYGFLGEEIAGQIVGSAAKDAETVKGYMQAFEQAGCDELIMFPCSSDPEQVKLLAEAARI
jgi:alkanesulfonate monooxygenase SsuD/methylene tetrahydromethanopterin reductase-like flavin-dependent oxidoreductase (luciferase family)